MSPSRRPIRLASWPRRRGHATRTSRAGRVEFTEKSRFRHFSLISTTISRHPTTLLLLGLRRTGPDRLPTVRSLRLLWSPFPPRPVQQQHHEPHQRLPLPPLVPHL